MKTHNAGTHWTPYLAVAFLFIAWNLWLPLAKQFFNQSPGIPGIEGNYDFSAYLVAGKSFAMKLDPYIDNSGIDPTLAGTRGAGYSRYIYPPTALPLFAWLAQKSYHRARYIWAAGGLLAFVLACALLFGLVSPLERKGLIPVAILITLTSSPLLDHLGLGQINLWIMSLCVISFAVRQRNRAFAALLLAIATVVKVNPVILLSTFVLFDRDWRFLVYFIAWLSAVLGLSFHWVSPALYREFFSRILPTIVAGNLFFFDQSILRFFGTIANAGKTICELGFLSIGVLGWYWGARRRSLDAYFASFNIGADAAPFMMFFVNVVATLLFSGLSWHSAYVWVIPFCARWLVMLPRIGHRWFTLCGVAGVFMLNARLTDVFFLRSINIFGGMLVLGCLLALMFEKIPPAATQPV